MKTLQEIYTTAREHLLAQGRLSRLLPEDRGSPMCAYRSPDGLKCAVGCLIADEYYRPQLERQGAVRADVLTALEASGFPITDDAQRLYTKLQDIHDDFDPVQWQEALNDLADECGLQVEQSSSLRD